MVIPTLNEERHILGVLDQLMAERAEMSKVRIVIADGGSTDDTRKLVERYARDHPNVLLIDNPKKLQSAAVNLAVETCAEPEHVVLVRCDAHASYPPGYVQDVANSLATRDVAALATVMDSTGSGCFQKGLAWVVDTPLGSGGSGHRGGTVSGYVDHGHHAGFCLDMWRQIGGYAEDFIVNEDAELDHRISRAGGRIWLDADIRVTYHVRPDPISLAKQYWRYGRGRARTVMKHNIRPRARQLVPAIATATIIVCILLAVALHPVFLLPVLGYFGILLVASILLAVKHRSLCGLWAGVALGAMHLPWGAGFLWQRITGKEQRS